MCIAYLIGILLLKRIEHGYHGSVQFNLVYVSNQKNTIFKFYVIYKKKGNM